MDKDRAITVAIIIGLFGGLIGGPIASMVYYEASPEIRFTVFIIPEIVGFICNAKIPRGSELDKKQG